MKDQLVIVIGFNYLSRIGMIRAAGIAGYRVALVCTDFKKRWLFDENNIDSESKYLEKVVGIKGNDETDLVDSLIREFSAESKKPVLLPTDDRAAAAIDNHLDLLRPFFLYPNILDRQSAITELMDKAAAKEIAKRCGFQVTSGWTAKWENCKYKIPDDVSYPCFIKSKTSAKRYKKAMRKCDSKEMLEDALADIPHDKAGDILIEEYINIEQEYDIPGLSIKEGILVPGMIEKVVLEEGAGTTAVGEIKKTVHAEDLCNRIKKFIGCLELTGLFDIDFFVADGQIYFCEVNLRLGTTGFAVTNSGVNLPELFIRSLCGERVEIGNCEVEQHTFAIERSCLINYRNGFTSWKEYLEQINTVDFTFIYNSDDPVPGQLFKRIERVSRPIRQVKKLLGEKNVRFLETVLRR